MATLREITGLYYSTFKTTLTLQRPGCTMYHNAYVAVDTAKIFTSRLLMTTTPLKY